MVHMLLSCSRRFCATAIPAAASLSAAGIGPVRWPVRQEECGARLDRFIKRRAPGLPPGLIQRLIRQRRVTVAGETAIRNAHLVRSGDVVELPGDIKLGLSRGKKKPKPDDVSLQEAQYIRSRVIHRDARCVVLDKPAGLPTQGGTGIGERHVEALLPGIGEGRYFLVHRLDKEVSGALAIARDVGAAAELADHFRRRRVEKEYWALVVGNIKSKGGVIALDVNGKSAETHFRVVQDLGGLGAWVALRPRTGRKHQLRIHCAMGLQAPIVGESRYTKHGEERVFDHLIPQGLHGIAEMAEADAGLHLHSRSLSFPKLTVDGRRQGKKKNSGDGGLRSMLFAKADIPPHMKSSFRRFGLNVRHGDEVEW